MGQEPERSFQSKDIFPNLFAGFISGLMTLIGSISYATLIFSGARSGDLHLGIYSALVSAAVIGFVVATRSSSPFTIAGPDANISAILALMVADVGLKTASATPVQVYTTIWAAIALSGFLSGVFLFLVGRFKLGKWIRFIPYPVVGGFLAGTGWILVRGSFKVMTDTALTFDLLPRLMEHEYFIHWLPGLGFGLLVLVVTRRFKHFLVLPSLLVGAIVAGHFLIYFSGESVAQAGKAGWLLSSLPGNLVAQSWKSLSMDSVQWSALSGQAGNLSALLIVAAIVILLNAASVEIETKSDVDLDNELKSTGIANLFSAPLGGMVGCIALSRSIMNYKAGATARLSGMVAALLCGAILLVGTSSLNYLPRPVLGGLLLFLGAGLLLEWLYRGWFRFSRFDYFLVIIIFGIIAVRGFLPGVAIGLVIACMLFAFNYSRINVIRHEQSGSGFRSNVERSFKEKQVLKEKTDAIFILQLQGYIFFGTAYPLLTRVTEWIKSLPKSVVQFVILDFSYVSGIDSSSVLSFSKMRQLTEANNAKLIFVHLTPQIHKLLVEGGCIELGEKSGLETPQGPTCQVFPDLDYAIGWCEDQILAAQQKQSEPREESLEEHLGGLFPHLELMPRLRKYLEKVVIPPGIIIFQQGEPSTDLYFVESGEVTALLELPGRMKKRLRTMGAGTVVGEMGLYMEKPRSATIVTEKMSTLYRLRMEAFKRMEQEDPELASALHEFMVRLLAGRLAHADEELARLTR
jgi:sulfate permease, SulP family